MSETKIEISPIAAVRQCSWCWETARWDITWNGGWDVDHACDKHVHNVHAERQHDFEETQEAQADLMGNGLPEIVHEGVYSAWGVAWCRSCALEGVFHVNSKPQGRTQWEIDETSFSG